MRIILLPVALILLATFAPPRPYQPPPPPAVSMLFFEPLALDRRDPEQTKLGGLAFLGGWAIESNDPRFGGLSALHVEEGRALALSDTGVLASFALPPPGASESRALISPLPQGAQAGQRKSSRDTEALVVHGAQAWIGFESVNAVRRYSRDGWRENAAQRPAAMRKWRANGGSEAMLRLPDGRFLIFSEGPKGRRDSEVLLFDGDPTEAGSRVTKLTYRALEGYHITDAARLPDGRMLFLNRRFALPGGFSARLTTVRLPALKQGVVLEGEEIATFAWPLLVDNLEALSIVREGGRTILWIASDDNFSPLQRTLLLKFALEN